MADGNVMPAEALDARAIGDVLGVSARSVRRRAATESWPSEVRKDVGGQRIIYPLATLPEDIRTAISRKRALAAAAELKDTPAMAAGRSAARLLGVAEAVDAAVAQREREAGQAAAAALTGKACARMEAKLALLAALGEFAHVRGIGICAAMDEFCDAYNSGAAVVPASVRNFTGADLHPSTLRRWRRIVKTKGPAPLAGGYGNRKGSSGIDANPALRQFVLAVVVEKPHISAKLIRGLIAARMPQAQVPLRNLQRWLVAWKRANAELFLAVTNPDAWKNKKLVAFGSYAEGVTRANQLWMLDSTPADVQLLDGRHSILGVIDVATRRARLVVSKNSTAEAVCQLLRRAILDWGVPDTVKMDNGRDYASERVAGVLVGLGIEARFSAPFSPWEKGQIERFFGTFSRHALELLPGYSGHNVVDAQAIRARKSFSEQLHSKNKVIEAKLTAAELQAFCDKWVDTYYMHEPHSGEGMGGKTPFEKTAQLRDAVRAIGDVRGLDLLLGAGTLCTVGKKGIRLDGLRYIAPELEKAMGEKVLVRRDDGDMGRVVVYFEDAFLCVAECAEVTGISRMEVASEARARQRTRVQDGRKALRKLGKLEAAGDLAKELLDERARATDGLVVLPPPNVVHLTPALEAATEAADQLAEWTAGDAAERIRHAEAWDGISRVIRSEQQKDETAEDRFKAALKTLLQAQATPLNELEERRLRNYQTSPEFEGRWMVFEEFGAGAFGLADHYNALLPADALFNAAKGM